MRKWRTVLILAFVVSGCSDPGRAKRPPIGTQGQGAVSHSNEPKESLLEATCQARSTRMAQRLTKHADRRLGPAIPDIEPLRANEGGEPEPDALIFVLREDGGAEVLFGRNLYPGELHDFVAQARKERAERASHSNLSPPSLAAIYLWVDRRTPSATLEEFLIEVPKGLELRLLALGPKPQRTELDRQLAATVAAVKFDRDMESIEPGMEGPTFAVALDEALGPKLCRPARNVLAELGGFDPSAKKAHLASRLPEALAQCDCQVANANLIEYLAYWFQGLYGQRSLWVPLPRNRTGAKRAADLLVASPG